MRKKFVAIGSEVQAHITGAERCIDEGLIADCDLLRTMLLARLELGYGGSFKREIVEEVGTCLAEGLGRRARLLNVHASLSAFAKRMGYSDEDFGDSGPKAELDVRRLSIAAVPDSHAA